MRPPIWRRALGEPAGIPDLDVDPGRAGRRPRPRRRPRPACTGSTSAPIPGAARPIGSRGIYLMEFDTRSGELGPPRVAAASPSPSFLAIHPNREFLYAVNEEIPGHRERGRQRLRDRPEQGDAEAAEPAVVGRLRALATSSSTGGDRTCWWPTTAAAAWAACRSSGTAGSGRPRRSSSIEARSPTPAGRAARTRTRSTSTRPTASPFAADLGLDKVFVYAFDADEGDAHAQRPALRQGRAARPARGTSPSTPTGGSPTSSTRSPTR